MYPSSQAIDLSKGLIFGIQAQKHTELDDKKYRLELRFKPLKSITNINLLPTAQRPYSNSSQCFHIFTEYY